MHARTRPRSDTTIEERALALVRRFRRQRPLRGGSLIITIFGDAIAPRGGDIALGSLILLAAPFGMTERLVRTSVGRLANDGWLESHRRGRLSYYRLSETGRTRFAEATLRIYGETRDDWDGEWTLIVMDAALGRRRDQLREELAWLGFGQVLPGMLAHPAHDLEDTWARLAELDALAHVTILRARPAPEESAARLVAAGWDLEALARSYRRFVAAFEPAASAIANADALLSPRTSFVIRTLLIHEYRKIHLRDPLLPRSLLPDDCDRIGHRFTLDEMVPAPAQGALAVEMRADDDRIGLVAGIDDPATRMAVETERALLELTNAGCRAALGAYAVPGATNVVATGFVDDEDGPRRAEGSGRSPVEAARALQAGLGL